MKNIFFFSLLVSLGLFVIAGCTDESDPLTTSDDKSTFLKKKPVKDVVVYKLTYSGFLTNTDAYALETVNNKKREAMDIAGCGKSYKIFGIANLANSVSPLMPCGYPDVCVFNNGIDLNKKNGNRVRAHIQYDSGLNCSAHEAIWMYGNITTPAGGSTLYPATEANPVTIEFDTWWLVACDEYCGTGNTQGPPNYFLNNGGVGQQSLVISIAPEEEGCDITPCIDLP